MPHTGEFHRRQNIMGMGDTDMRTISRKLAVLAALLPAFASALERGFTPPTVIFYSNEFTVPTSTPSNWELHSGSWSVANGSFNSTSAAAAAATIVEYIIDPNGPPDTGVAPPYTFRARVRNHGAAATSLAGVVFDYQDAANYSEAMFAPTGTYFVRQVREGTATMLVSGSYSGGGQNVWFDVEVIRKGGTVLVHANGVGGVTVPIAHSPGFGGRVGLTSRNTTARFDKLSIAMPFGAQPFKEDFSSALPSNWITGGQWSVAGGTLDNTSVQQINTASASEFFIRIAADSTFFYTLRARMLNPYGGTGNLVGMFFNDTGFSRGEILFSPRGVARIDLTRAGVTQTIATAAYPGRPNEWFDVRADVTAGDISVAVNGVALFQNVQTDDFDIFQGRGGLITHWAPARFDDVWFDNRSTFAPLSVTFDSVPPEDWTVSGTWSTSGGVLNNVSAGIADILTTNCACWETDFSYRARLLNQYAASGNLIGLVYNYQRDTFGVGGAKPYVGLYRGDYYEVVFAPTGQAFINKVLNGVRYRVASGTHGVPRNVWFDVEVLRQGVNTTVKVNGATVFDRVPQGELPFGDVGVVSHWSKARFDTLAVTDAPLR